MDAGVHEEPKHLSRLLQRIAAGEVITIRWGGEAVDRIVPTGETPARSFGVDHGMFEVPDDFNDPLPAGVLELFQR